MRLRHVFVFATLAAFSTAAHSQPAKVQTVQDDLAAQVRIQGFTCDKTKGAIRDKKRSKPDYAVWTLVCSNAVYRVSRAPDMLAKIQVLR